VQTLDKQGNYYPATLEGAQPSLKVMVDSVPPDVRLTPLPPRGGQVGVEWDVREEYMDLTDPKALRLEYRVVGGFQWIPLAMRNTINQFYWNPETNAPLEVRLRAQDRAGNIGEAGVKLRAGDNLDSGSYPSAIERPAQNPVQNPLPKGYGGELPNRRLVNSRRIRLNYSLKEVGPSGVSSVELWFTQDGRSWLKFLTETPKAAESPEPLVFDVEREGIYGFTVVAKSGVGLGTRPPQIGDTPQIWVEVDLTKPRVELHEVLVGRGLDKGKLTLQWSATDKNLKTNPITISYAEQQSGPWNVITEHAGNTGRYVWSMPENVPYQFWVRVEAADAAGNVGEDLTRDLVKVDLSQHKVNILDVVPELSGSN
jgi:hypothetical protein